MPGDTSTVADWHELPDRDWPGRPAAGLQRLLIGPTGVFVVAEHDWTGRVSRRNDLLRSDDRSRDLHVRDSVAAAGSVAALLPADFRAVVRPVLCLTRHDRVALVSRGALVCGAGNLAETLGAGPRLLDADHRAYLESVIRAAMRLAEDGVVLAVRERPRRPGAASPTIPAQRRPVSPDLAAADPLPERPETPRAVATRAARSFLGVLVLGALVVLERVTDATALIARHLP